MTMDTMLDEMKVHEMIVVAIERDWHVIEKHIDSIQDLERAERLMNIGCGLLASI